MSIMNDSYAEHFGCSFVAGGGVSTALGFKACGIHAGFWDETDRADLAIVIADEPCAAAGVFTQNVFCAAPVSVCREHLNATDTVAAQVGESEEAKYCGTARAIMVNSAVANAATGDIGMKAARMSAHLLASELGCSDDEILIASTGVIGVHLPIDPFESGIPVAVGQASRDGGASAACAIMTTDTHPKECAVTFNGDDIGFPGVTFSVGGMAKGAGMIMPQMATMIAVITTDVPVAATDLSFALKNAVDVTFNKVTIDSDTSTNDSCFLMASGAALNESSCDASKDGGSIFKRDSAAFAAFERALYQVCSALARAMAQDGEGATRLVTVNVCGAASEADADAAARAVANSPLTKAAIYGHDANWGRIAAALGRSGACFSQENVDIDIMGIPVCRKGLTVAFDEDEARARFEAPEIVIDADLGEGDCKTTVWTCDLSHEYVSINGDYRS